MPYDLCEDDPTLDIIETAMANRGNDAATFFSLSLYLLFLFFLVSFLPLVRTWAGMCHLLFFDLQFHKQLQHSLSLVLKVISLCVASRLLILTSQYP